MPRQPAASSQSVVQASDSSRLSPSLHVSEYVTNGGSSELGVNGSVSPVTFSYTPPTGYGIEASRIIIYMESAGAMASDEFGNITALANGVQLYAGGVLLTTWQDNIDVLTDMFDFSPAGEAFAKVTQTLSGRWTFTKDTNGNAINIQDGQSFDVVVNDDLSTMVSYRIKVKGKLYAD